MKNHQLRQNELVRVINQNSRFHNEIAILEDGRGFSPKAIIRLANGERLAVLKSCLTMYMSSTEEEVLVKAHNETLIDFALQIQDKEWFMELTSQK